MRSGGTAMRDLVGGVVRAAVLAIAALLVMGQLSDVGAALDRLKRDDQSVIQPVHADPRHR